MKPSIGRVVHYVSYGTPGGDNGSECRAAIITEVGEAESVGLVVFNPTGLFLNADVRRSEQGHPGGTWHEPERVED